MKTTTPPTIAQQLLDQDATRGEAQDKKTARRIARQRRKAEAKIVCTECGELRSNCYCLDLDSDLTF